MSKVLLSSSVVALVEVELTGWMHGYLEYASIRTSQFIHMKLMA